MEKKIISLIGVLLMVPLATMADDNSGNLFYNIIAPTVIAAAVSGVISIYVANKKRFADTVTKVRNEYIKELRSSAAELCAYETSPDTAKEHERLSAYYKIMLMLNPNQPEAAWDVDIIQRMRALHESGAGADRQELLNRFIRIMQSDLALEWHGMMEEGRRGELSDTRKDQLRLEFYHVLYQQEENIQIQGQNQDQGHADGQGQNQNEGQGPEQQ